MKDFDRLIVRFMQFGGLRLVWEYAKLGLLWEIVCQVIKCVVTRKSFKSIYPKILAKVEPVLVQKYLSHTDCTDEAKSFKFQDSSFKTRIWFCWLQGLENAPELAKCCLESLKQLGTEIVVITAENYKEWCSLPEHVIEKNEKGYIPHVSFSDLIRLAIIKEHGGVWIDSTVLYTHTDCTDCTDNTDKKYCPSWREITEAELFVFRYARPGEKWNGSLGTWFIAAQAGNELIARWLDCLCNYWKDYDCLLDYYMPHLFFAELSKEYPEMMAKMPYGFGSACLQLRNNLSQPFSQKKWEKICSLSNFHKMSPRVRKTTVEGKDNFYHYILKGERI